MNNVTDYNTHVYPKKMWQAWTPELVVIPSLAALQLAFQLGNYLYLRSDYLQEQLTQLLTQKKSELVQVEREFKNLSITDDSTFQEL
jgi:hypothetical protein